MNANLELFEAPSRVQLGAQAWVLRGAALPYVPELLASVAAIASAAPFRHLVTPGGLMMSVAMTNCGPWGWTSDCSGYRYARQDPQTGREWPAMPSVFLQLAQEAATQAGFGAHVPDACLINRYAPGTRLSLHQDRDERDRIAPIVSVSLGVPATFLFGGLQRGDRTVRTVLTHGDVVVWGGVDRMRFHGVLPIGQAQHELLGNQRLNLTFRKVD
jgi:alkylated DNA repair protein (DNA oxidative demethylase)